MKTVITLLAIAMAGCTSIRAEVEHVSHPFAGRPFGERTEEDSLNTANVIGRRQYGRAYLEAGLGYKLRDGGFYGPDITFTSRFGYELWAR